MKVVVINEDNHGFIGVAKDLHSAIHFLINEHWITECSEVWHSETKDWKPLSYHIEESSFTNMIDFLYNKVDNDQDFFDDWFYFEEEEVYETKDE